MNAETRNIFRTKRETGDHGAHSRELEEENVCVEGEGKVKTKLLSMWNNVKYGWTVKLKTNFSKDSPVWLLGKCYHRKMTIEASSQSDEGNEGEGIEGFKTDFISRVWLTYRREFPNLNGSSFTTDCGWGCMLRSGQMLLAQGLVCHILGRGWRWYDQKLTTARQYNEDKCHRKIIKWFGDNPSCNSPFSIHMLVTLGEASGKRVGDWYGPGSVSHLLRQAVELATKENKEFEHLCVYVAQDCAVYIQDIVDLCDIPQTKPQAPSQSLHSTCSWRALILLVPVRLGVEKLNSVYGPCLTAVLTLENCIGIIGGRPKHSLYFVGFQDDKLIHLDPHYCQEVVDVWQPNFPLLSFHCRSPRKMNLSRLDPSCCIGFYCRTRDDFYKFMKNVKQVMLCLH
ncbi:cysteine protease ATG4D isoform X2 [Zootermopsis nevadensis]|uniref:cysteine protease ATG4D isoform X2 n=1 Tax=Zootermopsis nevadensis TaxID=136037 RepID=UPI000B8EDA11|nr:cysteine protease ATG4D isoform X2 [Zootermopsis nevadensis]